MKSKYVILFIILLVYGCTSSGQISKTNNKETLALLYYQMAQNIVMHKDMANLPKAFIYLQKAQEITPNNPNIYYVRALAFQLKGNKKGFLSNIKETLRLSPNFYDALNALGVYYSENGQYKKAIEIFTHLINDPLYQHADAAMYNRALVWERERETNKAINDLKNAIMFSNYQNKLFWKQLIAIEVSHRMYKRALNSLKTMELYTGNSDYIAYTKALCYKALGMTKQALMELDSITNKKSPYYLLKLRMLRDVDNADH